ncbi:MAG: DUF4430 domain-containing protein [Solirubrobacterales bacterium]
MTALRGTVVAAALLIAVPAATGCGLGPGEQVGSVELTVTRDFGAVPMVEDAPEANESDTVMRVLEGSAEIETRYGGAYVSAIDGVAEGSRGGRPHDWFYFVDGVEAPIGAAERSLRGGERIWWDYRDWSASNRVAAVVGSWPAPFAAGYEGRSHPVAVVCEGGGEACGEVREALSEEGVAVADGVPKGAIRVLVGPWARLREDPAAALLEAGPGESGVYAEFAAAAGGYELRGLDPAGAVARRFGPEAGLVAATRWREAPPTWLVTGAGGPGVRAAAGLLGVERLRDHYAVATEGGREESLPLR